MALQAFRLRFSQPGEALALGLSRAATGAAVFRAIDGAQNLVASREVSGEIARTLVAEGTRDAELLGQMLSVMMPVGSVLMSLFVVGLFVLLSSYFGSDGLRALLQTPRAE